MSTYHSNSGFIDVILYYLYISSYLESTAQESGFEKTRRGDDKTRTRGEQTKSGSWEKKGIEMKRKI